MTAEDIAREAQFREGFTLVDYSEVGLPIFRLTIEAITTATRTTPTIQEFVMRCMSLGERDEASIARMLGLKEEIVRAAVNTLVFEGFVARTSVLGDHSTFALTPSGQERLAEETQEVIQEEMIVTDYDGIRRMPIRLAGENVVRASELKMFGAVEIRPYPSEPPSVNELSIPEITRVIRRQGGEDFRHNVLALKRIVRRNNLFREAVALVFVADRGNEVQVAFAIDGKLSESHERAFAENGGPRKMGFVRMMGDSADRRRLDRLVGRDVIRAVPDPQRVRSARKEEAVARAQVRSIEPAAETGRGRSGTSPAVIALSQARERHALAMHELDAMEVRPLACYEQNELLHEAVKNATRALSITSAGLQPSVLPPWLLRDIENLTRERVAVRIASFVKPQTEPRGGDHYDPLSGLTKLAQKNKMELIHTGRTAFFFLIQDDDLAVISNRPFFGEMVRRSGFQSVAGLVTRRKTTVEKFRELASGAFKPKKNA